MGRMPSLKAARRSMKHRLSWHMAMLAAILIAAVLIGLFFFGRLSSPKAEMERTLQTQMDFFRDDMRSLWQNVSTSAVHLSGDMTKLLEDCLKERGTVFEDLTGDLESLTALEEAMIGPLCQYARQTRCSGAFLILDAAMRTDSAPDVRSGLCIQKNNAERAGNELLLFRGMAGVGKAHGIMPHRKWQQEFRTEQFPDYDTCVEAAGEPLWNACRITDLITLPGTSERAMFLTVPMVAEDGTVYGICGFSVNQTYFCAYYEQPSDLSRLACLLTADTDGSLSVDGGLITYTKDGSCTLPTGTLSVWEQGTGISRFSGGGYEFVGKMEPITFASGDDTGHTLAVLIPKEDYDRAVLDGVAQTVIFAFLLVFFVVVCCVIFARWFLRPVYEDIKYLQTAGRGREQITFDEVRRVSASLLEQDREHRELVTTLEGEKESLQSQYEQSRSQLESARRDAKDLAEKQKERIDPELLRHFREELGSLTRAERRIYDAYTSGMDFPEIAATFTAKESTLRSQTQSVYKKLGVNSLTLLRRYAALVRQEQEASGQPRQ